MDILTHTLSGIACGTTIIPYTNRKPASVFGVLGLSAFFGAIPDVDAIRKKYLGTRFIK
ncbi:MAG: hypothetical protein JXA77_16865 [Bacteroidales bacterium]|nr:hypothetical protein [Bacteroidales bacterium]MBN2819373.1 hypothetical protein [Bacteroidales bacterium]